MNIDHERTNIVSVLAQPPLEGPLEMGKVVVGAQSTEAEHAGREVDPVQRHARVRG
jgi:hypothetical protein